MRSLSLNITRTHQVGNSEGIFKVDDNKQLLIAIVVASHLIPNLIRFC